MFYSLTERQQRTSPVYGPAPYQQPWSERPGATEEVTFVGWNMSSAHPADPNGFRQQEKIDPKIAAVVAASRLALDDERDHVRAVLGLDEPLDPNLTFSEQVESQRMRIDLALNEPRVDQLGEQVAPQPVPVAVGQLAMAGASA